MATLTVTLPTGTTVVNGKQVTFRAPCDCTDISGIVINGTTYTLVDATTEQITGHTFKKDAMVSVIMDTENNKAFVQNGIIYGVSTVELSRAEYDALVSAGEIDQNTIYVVTDDNVSTGGVQFIVDAPSGTAVTASYAGVVVSRTGSGVLEIPSYGTWVVTGNLSGQTMSTTIVVDTVKQYNVVLRFYPANFADATWEQIIEACQNDIVPATWVVGDSKTMSVGSNRQIDIIGKHHDTYTDGGIAPLTFQFHDIYTEVKFANNEETLWANSIVRNTTLPSVISSMPAAVRSALRYIDKTNHNMTGRILNVTSDNMFILAEAEVFSTVTEAIAGEGTQYEYYKVGNKRIKMLGSTAKSWWLRSLDSSDTRNQTYVDEAGKINSAYSDANTMGVVPAFCF